MDQLSTNLQKSQNVHGYAPFWYVHSTALPQSYPGSIGSGRGNLKFSALIGIGTHATRGWQADPKMYWSIYGRGQVGVNVSVSVKKIKNE